jgi:hypothetical protein
MSDFTRADVEHLREWAKKVPWIEDGAPRHPVDDIADKIEAIVAEEEHMLEVATMLAGLDEAWRDAPCRLELKAPGHEVSLRSMAWKRILSDEEREKTKTWAIDTYGDEIELVWSAGESASPT